CRAADEQLCHGAIVRHRDAIRDDLCQTDERSSGLRAERSLPIMKQHERIVRDPKVMLGKPVIRGTRITVEHIPQELGGGLAPEQIVAGYPHLTLEDIRAAQAYAADYMADEEVAYG